MPLMSEQVGQKGVYTFLREIYSLGNVVSSADINQLIDECALSQDIFSELMRAGLLITAPQGYCISSIGKKVTILLKGINSDIDNTELYNQLTYLYPSLKPYELITHDVTNYFINNLIKSPNFIRIYICSPWIRLNEEQIAMLEAAIFEASKKYPNLKIYVITKPEADYTDWDAAATTFELLLSFGAEIMTNSKLHTKLYISEPGPEGGDHFAILGSENLTGKKNIELAIKIQNDNVILRNLSQYFFSISEKSRLLRGI